MNGGSLGIRCGSYGSLQQQLPHKGLLPVQTTPRKPGKLLKEKEKLRLGIFKFAGHRNVGMLLLCLISAAVFMWVLYVGKGEDSQDNIQISNFNKVTSVIGFPGSLYEAQSISNASSYGTKGLSLVAPPPPPAYFLGYTLPPGHPCNSFTIPPPPANMKRPGPRPCPVCYLPVEEAIALMPKDPSPSPVLKNLTYVHEENLSRDGEFGGSDFGGYPTLRQRNDSFDIRESMTVHCGFVRGRKPGRGTGFNIGDSDLLEMEQCNGVVVASAIFGNFDEIQQPRSISKHARKYVCFYMFIDEITEAYLKNTSALDISRKIGLWRVVIIRDLPYADARRSGKIPKLLLHRLFPNARYSLWIDGKLELVLDPYQILERFLWRKNATFAISRHYRRFDVFTEAEANKAAGKYDNASIDFQVEFYRKEGLTPYSEAKLPITSDVPEGCVIIREHVPISNLFTCLWFNEVDRFTARDQISFSTVRDKIMSKTNWNVYMFLDCERRNFVVQKYHRGVVRRMPPPVVHRLPQRLPPLIKRVPARRSRRGSKRHRRVTVGNKDIDTG